MNNFKTGSSTRQRALNAVTDVLDNKEFTKEAVEKYSFDLSEIDRGFLNELVYGVIRNIDTINWLLKPFLRKPQMLDKHTLNNLRLAVYQLRFTNIKEYAVVNEAVKLESRRATPISRRTTLKNKYLVSKPQSILNKPENHSKQVQPALVNAVLRNYIRAGIKPLPEDIALSTSHKQWMIKRWIERFGIERTKSIAEANNKIAPMTLRTHINRQDISDILIDLGIKHEFTKYSPVGIRLLETTSIKKLEPLKGKIFIQDEAAQIAAYLICPQKGETILDICSAPGGKATHIAEITKDEASILAVDQSENRIDMIKNNIKALKINSIKTLCTDILEDKCINQKFDKIVLDPPCSSTGVIRKNPDVKYRISLKKLHLFTKTQVLFLEKASRYLKKNGILLYCVCSTEPEEGEDVINMFLHNNSEFYIINVANMVKERFGIDLKGFQQGDSWYRTFPDINNTDGFFFCVLGLKTHV